MFSDSSIPLKVFAGLIVLLLLGIYSFQYGNAEGAKAVKLIHKCVTLPSACINRRLVMRIRTKTWAVDTATAEVKAGKVYLAHNPIEFLNLTGRQSAGRIVDVLGSFDRDGRFSVIRQREDDWIQTTKYVVSLIGLGLCLYLFTRLYALSPGCRLPLIPRHPRQ